MKLKDYFTISHYLPEGVYQRNKEMANYLRNSHYCKRGLHSKEAEHQFIRYVQEMKEYGLHLYSAVWVSDSFPQSTRNAIDSVLLMSFIFFFILFIILSFRNANKTQADD